MTIATPSTEHWNKTTFAGVLYGTAERLLAMSYGASSITDRAHLQRAARQVALVGELVEIGSKTVAEAEAWVAASRVFIYEWTVQHAPLG